MTESEAHKFIARWSRHMIIWGAKTEAEKLKALERSFRGMTISGIFFLFSASLYRTSSFRQGMFMFGLIMFVSACGLIAQARKARQALEKS
jgi:hypothetical protein